MINQSDFKNQFIIFVKFRITISVWCLYISVIHLSVPPVFELYRGLWGSPLFFFFFFFFITGGGGGGVVRLRVPQKRTYNDLQRYTPATSVCTTCFMQALYRINHYTVFTLVYFIDTN